MSYRIVGPFGIRGFAVFGCIVCSAAAFASTNVPGTSDPWLAGMPAGSTASSVDSAPAESPVQLLAAPIIPGATLEFSATGLVTNDASIGDPHPPDGDPITPPTAHNAGAENGIGNVIAPFDSLIGIFLGPDQPNLTAAPTAVLDFSTQAARDYLSLSPALKQPFFIGDGLTSGDVQQQVVVPAGTTRLFLATMDSYGWSNNGGSFDVSLVPEPAPWLLACIATLALVFGRAQRA